MVFYSIDDKSSNGSYSSLKVGKDELFLCDHEKRGSSMDQCADYSYLGFIANKLPEAITITFDGLAKKTRKWGINTIDSGPSPMTYFRGYFYRNDKKETIWVNTHQLMWMFESKSDFKNKNSDAYNALVLNNRLHPH